MRGRPSPPATTPTRNTVHRRTPARTAPEVSPPIRWPAPAGALPTVAAASTVNARADAPATVWAAPGAAEQRSRRTAATATAARSAAIAGVRARAPLHHLPRT